MKREADTPFRRILDQPFIFERELLMDMAGGFGGSRLGAAAFGLLPQEQIIDVHVGAPLLAPVEATNGGLA